MMVDDGVKAALAAMRARCEAATPGPWHAGIGRGNVGDGEVDVLTSDQRSEIATCWPDREQGNATFIAAARTDLPKLLAVAEAALAASMVDVEVNDKPHRALDAALAALGEP